MYKHKKKRRKGPQERNEVVVTVRSKSYQSGGKCEHGFNVVGKMFLLGRNEGKEKKKCYINQLSPSLSERGLVDLSD